MSLRSMPGLRIVQQRGNHPRRSRLPSDRRPAAHGSGDEFHELGFPQPTPKVIRFGLAPFVGLHRLPKTATEGPREFDVVHACTLAVLVRISRSAPVRVPGAARSRGFGAAELAAMMASQARHGGAILMTEKNLKRAGERRRKQLAFFNDRCHPRQSLRTSRDGFHNRCSRAATTRFARTEVAGSL